VNAASNKGFNTKEIFSQSTLVDISLIFCFNKYGHTVAPKSIWKLEATLKNIFI